MHDLPSVIPFTQVASALESLGIPIKDTISVHFGTDGVTVVEARTDPSSGRNFAAGNELATVTTVIGYDRKADL